MPVPLLHVLFVCTGNSARSIIAEGLLTHLGRADFIAHSAGSHPRGAVNPLAVSTLEAMGLPTRKLRSKSWDEFSRPGAPTLDFVFTVCDSAAGESCPVWPGGPLKAHWGVPDPAAVVGTPAAQRTAFLAVYRTLEARVRAFIALPVRTMDRGELQTALNAIGDR